LPSDRGGLFGPLTGGSGADAEVSDRAVLQAMLDAERALAVASVMAGLTTRPRRGYRRRDPQGLP
jgi:3-carboxy-cis,cis-muconate cycloisomerase